MRILLLDTTAHQPASPLFLEALQELVRQYPRDYDYAFVDEALFQRSSSTVSRVARKLWQRPPLDLNGFNQFLLRQAHSFKPHMLLICKGAYVFPETLAKIKRDMETVLVNFATDDPFNTRVNTSDLVASIPIYDVYACTKRAIMPDIKFAGCNKAVYVPFGYKPMVHFPEPPVTSAERQRFASDVAFIGGGDRDRASLISALLKAIPDLNLALYGGKWNRSLRLRRHWRGVALGRDFRMALSGTKIALNLVRRANRDGHVMRTFEIPACGAFMLADRSDEHLDLLNECEEAVYFGSTDELVEQVSRHLYCDMSRRAIADRGYGKVTRGAHTYRDRLMTLLGIVASL